MTTTPKNIYIVGAQCTGKTTLVNALESHFASRAAHDRPAIVREVARTVLETHSLAATDIRFSPQSAFEMQRLMLLAQVDAERDAMTEAGWFISDRSGVDPVCYALSHAGEDAANELLATAAWAELKPRLERGLIVVCEAGCRWLVDDGVRLMPLDQEEWIGFHVLFCSVLDGLKLPYIVLPAHVEDLQERVQYVLASRQEMITGRLFLSNGGAGAMNCR